MDRAEMAVKQWARERPDLPALPMAIFGRLSDAAERTMRDHNQTPACGHGVPRLFFNNLFVVHSRRIPLTFRPEMLHPDRRT